MSLQNIPESFLYALVPDGVLSLDERGLMRSLIGGYQERLEDLRSYASKFELAYDPASPFPETDLDNVLEVHFMDGPAEAVRTLPITASTPVQSSYPTIAEWEAAAVAWAAAAAKIPAGDIVQVSLAHDPLKSVDTSVIQYLAATVGAVLYNPGASAASLADQRRAVASYFPRLKVKGTAKSFTVLGQLMTFNDVKMTPLWGRVSPRVPNDVGAPDNDQDFSPVPSVYPQQFFDTGYNPWDLADGPFFSWQSGPLSTSRADQNFYPQGVNGRNPFFTVTVAANGSVYHPGWPSLSYPQTFELSGGGAHAKASCVAVAQSGTEVAEVKLWALAEGESFNGLQVMAPAAGSLVVADSQLSAIKYRTSYFDLSLTTEFAKFTAAYGDQAVRKNPSLSPADGGSPVLCPDGTAVSPYRPWAGALPRHQASPGLGERQANLDKLGELGSQSSQYFDEVRAASRFPRRVLFGFMVADHAIYAAFPSREVLFTGGSLAPSGSGTASRHPLDPYSAVMTLEYPDGSGGYRTEVVRGAEQDPTVPTQYNYLAAGFAGWYDFATAMFSGTFSGSIVEGQRWVARWSPTSTEVVRPEPADALKSTGTLVGYQGRAEDQLAAGARLDVSESYPWKRDLTGGGEVVSAEDYLFSTPDLSVRQVKSTMTVPNQAGVLHDLVGLDAPSASSPLPIRTKLVPLDPGAPAGKSATAVRAGELYPVGSANGVLVADLPRFNNAVHRDGLVGWLPFNQHPEDAKVVLDHSKTAAPAALAGIGSEDRGWTARGWALRLASGARVETDRSRGLEHDVAFSVWLKPGAGDGSFTALAVGSARVLSGSIVAGQVYQAMGGPASYNGSAYLEGERFVGGAKATFSAPGARVVRLSAPTWPAEANPGQLDDQPNISVDLVSHGSLVAEFYHRTSEVSSGTQTASRQLFAAVPLEAGSWNFVYFSQSGSTYVAGRTASGTTVEARGANEFTGFRAEDTYLGCLGGPVDQQWSDLRIWNCPKQSDALSQWVQSYPHSKIPESASPSYFSTASRGERWTLEALATGWVFPAASDHEVSTPAMSRLAGASPVGGTLKYLPIPGSVVASHGSSIAADDGHGAILPGGSVLSGSVDYATGAVQVAVFGAGTQVVQVDYLRRSQDVERAPLARVFRYDGEGRFHGDAKFEEVGLGGGQDFASPWKLGQQNLAVQSAGSQVVSTDRSALPGVNAPWLETSAGSYYRVTPPYSDSGGSTTVVTGSPAPWPGIVTAENAVRQRAWVKGDSYGVYEVSLEDRGAGAELHAARVARYRSARELLMASGSFNDDQRDLLELQEILGANQAELATGLHAISVREVKGELHQGAQAGIDTTVAPTTVNPPSYKGLVRLLFTSSEPLDVHERVVLDVAEPVAGLSAGSYYGEVTRQLAPAAWQSGAETASGYDVLVKFAGLAPANFDPLYRALNLEPGKWRLSHAKNEVYAKDTAVSVIRPPAYMYLNQTQVFKAQGTQVYERWDDPASSADHSYAWRSSKGLLSFTNAGSLAAGNYVLSIDAGNLGQLDPGFSGFSTDVTIGDLTVPFRLLPDGAGFNPRGVTTLAVTLPEVPDPWTLAVDWTNDYDLPARGYQRSLAIYGYALERLETKLFRVDAWPFAQVEITGDARPGGWVYQVTSAGSHGARLHESQKLPDLRPVDGESGYVSSSPISSLLTATTASRRESLLFTGTNPVAPDESASTGPAVTGVAVAAGTIYVPN